MFIARILFLAFWAFCMNCSIHVRANPGEALTAPSKDFALSPNDLGIYHEDWIDFNKNGLKDSYEDPTVAVDLRVEDLLSQMSVEEKTCQLATLYGYQRVLKQDLPNKSWRTEVWKDGIANIDEHLNGVPGFKGKKDSQYIWPPSRHARAINEVQKWFVEETRLGIPVDFTNEGLRGVCQHKATNFPAPSAIGATWDRELVREIARVTGREAKALGYTNIYSPILDLARDPRWGRVVECYGEDPFLVGQLGLQQATGLVESGVASTCKHFAVYSVPKGGRDDAARTDPHVAQREVVQMYLKPFEIVLSGCHVQGVMSSYNDYDGIPISASKEFLINHLRRRMGFTGYVVSDSGAVQFLHSKHCIAGDFSGAVAKFLEAGGNVRTNFTAPQDFITPVRELIAANKISIDIVNERVRDVLRVKFELGLFDHPYVSSPTKADEVVRCDSHRQIALKAAQKSIVLLKNADHLLPLRKDIGAILVCGPLADEPAPCISRYGPTGGDVVTVFEGIRKAVPENTELHYAKGCEVVDSSWPESEIFPQPPSERESALISEAVSRARQVDVVVAVLGETESIIGESKSRTDLNLTGHQKHLVQALHETGKPIVVVLLNGRALSINWIDRHIPSIIEAWFPGEACGDAVADVLFGDFNPGGKLPVTFPRTVGQIPLNFPYKPESQSGQGKTLPFGVGKTRIVDALYPFGYGLSYTSFAYRDLKITPAEVRPDESVKVTCAIENTGDCAGEEVVQLYVHDDTSSVINYERLLCGFERIALEPGESKSISFTIQKNSLEILNLDMEQVVEPGSFTVTVGSSSQDHRLEGSFTVTDILSR